MPEREGAEMDYQMAKQVKKDLFPKNRLFALLKVVSLPGIVIRGLVIFISILLMSELVAAAPGRVEVRMVQQPPASGQEENRAAAERTFQHGMQLYRQGTAESLRQAIQKWEEALRLYRALGDKAREATTLSNIGAVYHALGEKQKALDYYNQSLPLFRIVGDKAREATTLSNIGAVYSDLGEKQKALDYYNQSLPVMQQVGDKAREAVTLLWSVNDAGTSELMKRYYQNILQKGLNPVAAMRAAQLEMIRSDQWKAPYYWASFVVQGEWRE